MEVQNDDDSNVDMAEVKRVLEDANMAEPNMTKELMISYYKALTNSKDTASAEDQTRRLNESREELETLLDIDEETVENTPAKVKETPFIPKAWASGKKVPLESALEHNNNENIIEDDILESVANDAPKDATKTTFGFNEMVKDSEYTLDIITHKLKYIPIQCTNKFLNARIAVKARMLYAYHTKLNKMKTEFAKFSFYPAPIPKITSTMETFPTFSDAEDPETYVCRSGRQTKRKIYNYDDEDSLDGVSNKKVKNSEEQEWISKPTVTKSAVRTQKKQETNKVSAEITKTEAEDINKEKKTLPKKETRTPLSRKMSNMEIMKRSSIFGGTPKKRCEEMFDKLKKEEEKREKEEKTMEQFNKTLEALDEENEEPTLNEEIISVDDEDFVKRRVVPPIPRKLINRKRYNTDGIAPLDIKVVTPPQKKEATAERNEVNQEKEVPGKVYVKKRPAIRRLLTTDSSDSLPSTSRTVKPTSTNSVTCPICDGSFEEDKIEEHAATCGDDPVPRSSSKISRITCEICDRVIPFDTNFEVHVKECIAKQNDKG